MITIDNYKERIRPDILAITVIPLTAYGHCMLMSFSSTVLEYGLNVLKNKKSTTKSMNSMDLWKYLIATCSSHCKKNNIIPNWKVGFGLLEVLGFEKDTLPVDPLPIKENINPERKSAREEVNKFTSYYKEENFNKCIEFERLRVKNNRNANPFWGLLYASQKKEMFTQFNYLSEMYEKDYLFTKDVKFNKVLHTHASTNYEHAENIIFALSEETDLKVRNGWNVNPFWPSLSVEEKEKMLISYAWYADIILNRKDATSWYTELAKKISKKVDGDKENTKQDTYAASSNSSGDSLHSELNVRPRDESGIKDWISKNNIVAVDFSNDRKWTSDSKKDAPILLQTTISELGNDINNLLLSDDWFEEK